MVDGCAEIGVRSLSRVEREVCVVRVIKVFDVTLGKRAEEGSCGGGC